MLNDISNESITSTNLNEGKTKVVLYIDSDERVNVHKDKGQKVPNHFRIGNGTMNKHKLKAIDLLQELADSTKPEQYLLLAIKNGISFMNNEYSPVVKLVGKTSTEKQYIKLGYKSLVMRGLVKRIKQSHYMINPNALIPPNYEGAMEIWNSVPSIVKLVDVLSDNVC